MSALTWVLEEEVTFIGDNAKVARVLHNSVGN